jgi:hypothetical protein
MTSVHVARVSVWTGDRVKNVWRDYQPIWRIRSRMSSL